MATNAIQPTRVKTGPGKILYKYGFTTMPTIAAPTVGKIVYDWATNTWTEVGGTDEGLVYTESAEVADIRVVESQYPIRRVTTSKNGSITFTMNELSDVNWKLAMNGGTITVAGSAGTKLSTYVPPLMGQEVRVALAFHSYDEDELIIWPQVFNTGSVETARGALETKAGLPVEMSVELPDAAVLDRPYKRWVSGPLAVSV